ncbi:T9SS type A sorting domain-containing protein [Saccharicrinis aurantiacus]|uniref:T9SS type A sorting domain-containing protein n=1 Tax=Saccharicrinis aurantiacus TaxID=1849719 RepID=UPI000838C550|nr:T9SS type A sorting domain-containing protein [Saccharicrinis aurantiacus]
MKNQLLKLSLFIITLFITAFNINASDAIHSVTPDATKVNRGETIDFTVVYTSATTMDIVIDMNGNGMNEDGKIVWGKQGTGKLTVPAGTQQSVKVSVSVLETASLGNIKAATYMVEVGGNWQSGVPTGADVWIEIDDPSAVEPVVSISGIVNNSAEAFYVQGAKTDMTVTYTSNVSCDLVVQFWINATQGNDWGLSGKEQITVKAGTDVTQAINWQVPFDHVEADIIYKVHATTIGGDWNSRLTENLEDGLYEFAIVAGSSSTLIAEIASSVPEKTDYIRGESSQMNVTYSANADCDLILEYATKSDNTVRHTQRTTISAGADELMAVNFVIPSDFALGQIDVKAYIVPTDLDYSSKVAELEQAGSFSISTTSNLNQSREGDIVIFPNPATTVLNIKAAQGSRISVYNAVGVMVYSNNDAAASTAVSVSDLTPGMYIIKVTNDSSEVIKKVWIK